MKSLKDLQSVLDGLAQPERVAEVERIELNNVWELLTVQFLTIFYGIREKG